MPPVARHTLRRPRRTRVERCCEPGCGSRVGLAACQRCAAVSCLRHTHYVTDGRSGIYVCGRCARDPQPRGAA